VSESPEGPRLFCMDCGTQATPAGQFCMKCGARLHREHLVPPPAATLSPPPAGNVRPEPGSRAEGAPWKPVVAILGLLLGGFLGGEFGQTLCYLGARASDKTAPGATPQVAALAESREGVGPGRMLGGLAGFMGTVLCLARPGRIRWFSFAIGALAGGAAGAGAGFLIGYF
jgi:hypothetical protein